jgi:Skp family chaperone for outer membrane proteins
MTVWDQKMSLNSVHTIKDKKPIDINHNETREPIYEDTLLTNLKNFPTSKCNRCKKDFAQMEPKSFKMCEHCRMLQRQRSQRWKVKTKQKEGVCKRCGTTLPLDLNNKFVLCEHCRNMLRNRKANRFLEGKCVHCSGPNSEDGIYKVCMKCREKDKIRRLTLEQEGLCNRCSVALPKEQNGHKICLPCRIKKKSYNTSNNHNSSLHSTPTTKIDPQQLYAHETAENLKIEEAAAKLESELNRYTTQTNDTHVKGDLATSNMQSQHQGMEINDYRQDESAFEDEKMKFRFRRKVSETYADINIEENNRDNQANGIVDQNLDTYSHSIDDDDVTSYEEHMLLSNTDKTLNGDILLSETFKIHHDHSQLNRQLKQLTQFTRHSTNDDDNIESDPKYADQSVLVDLNELENIGIDYDINVGDDDGDDDDKDNDAFDNDDDNESMNNDENNAEDEEEKETLLRHVRAVQASLLSNTTVQSDAEMAAAVEAVAVAAAVARGGNEKDE